MGNFMTNTPDVDPTDTALSSIASDISVEGPVDPVAIVDWLDRFATAIRAGDTAAVESLFVRDASWRDIVALTWDIRSFSGVDGLADVFTRAVKTIDPDTIALSDLLTPGRQERSGRPVVEASFAFSTQIGSGVGVVRFPVEHVGTLRAWTIMTSLSALDACPERVGDNRPVEGPFADHFGAPNWLELRRVELDFRDREPTVLIVGGGQAGLTIAARLKVLGLDHLVIEQNARVGDNWRNRYHSLYLHNQIQANHLPYLGFPETWPTYISKDKIAGWLELYVEAIELNVWTGTTFCGAQYDETTDAWTAEVESADGTRRTLRPKHVVVATGVSGAPRTVSLPGLEDFTGEVLHSSEFRDGGDYAGRAAVVFGVGNSANDVAQDLQANGCVVTMVQRGSTTVVSHDPGSLLLYEVYLSGRPLEELDLVNVSSPFPASYQGHLAMTKKVRVLDHELITKLNATGFKTDYGDDDSGFALKYLRTGGGHYLNVGCSELIIEGKIGVLQNDDLDHIDADGLVLRNGEHLPASVIVFGTGYEPMTSLVPGYFGADVAARVGEVWGLDEEGELRNMWRPTNQRGLWFHAGGLHHCRIFSKYLALQIAAHELGVTGS
jgi:cation diffusion facilitator CzcD-associated flavoprotein CzcO